MSLQLSQDVGSLLLIITAIVRARKKVLQHSAEVLLVIDGLF